MASEQQLDEPLEIEPTRIPRAVEGGTEYLEGLGRFVDDLLGDSRIRERTRAELEPLLMREDEMPDRLLRRSSPFSGHTRRPGS